ncbi:MAG: hypothetical protein ABIK53_06830 [bacterium]
MISKRLKFITVLFLIFLGAISLYAEETSAKFEKGDAIYSDLGENHILGWVGHAGLYMWWDKAEKNGIVNPKEAKNHVVYQSNQESILTFLGFSVSPGVEQITFHDFREDGDFWGVKTIKLSSLRRQQIVNIAKSKRGYKYNFFKGYKGPDTFRCDGLVEYCYEQAGKDIVPGDTWSPVVAALPGRILLTPKKQMDYLADPARFEQYTPQFDLIKFGELEDVICIDGEPVEPDYDGYYHINKNCAIKAYVSDGEYGSGIARFELWLGEPDDTPEKQGEDDNTGIRLDKNNDKHELCSWNNFDWDISDIKSGDYKVYAKVFDQAGNTKETYINVKIEEPPYYFHVQLSPEYVVTDGSEESQTQAFTITVQCYNYGTSETKPQVEGKRYVDKKEGTESWWHYINKAQNIDEWRKEKINPDCIAPEEWGKSDYAGEVSFGIANIINNAYELYAGGEKLETLELVDGAGSISGVVIKAEDGNIGDNHLFLIISASDGAGSGNNALMVNPILVDVNVYDDGETSPLKKLGGMVFFQTADEAWEHAVNTFNIGNWDYSWSYRSVQLYGYVHEQFPDSGWYDSEIWASKSRLRVDLTAYNPDDYISANLVVKPKLDAYDIYYNEQGWIEDKYNFLKNIKSELGTIWISTEYYAPSYTPSRPPLGKKKGYLAQYSGSGGYQGFYIALIPKMPE